MKHALNNEMNARIVTAESVCGHAGEQGRIRALSSLDAQVRQNSVRQNFLADGVPKKNYNKYMQI